MGNGAHWKTVWEFLKKVKHGVTTWSSNCTARRRTTRIKNVCPHGSLYVNVYSSILQNSQRWKKSKCLSVDEYISKRWYSHTMEFYLAIKMNEGPICAVTTRVNLENSMVSGRKQKTTEQCIEIWGVSIIYHYLPLSSPPNSSLGARWEPRVCWASQSQFPFPSSSNR